MSPSVAVTRALKRAIRRHPNHGLNGADISNMSRAQLTRIAQDLGLDVTQIVADATNGAPMVPDTDPADTDAASDPVQDQLDGIKGLIMTGGFAALDDTLRDLIRQANKPPVVQTVTETVTVHVPAGGGSAGMAPVTHAVCTGQDETWGKLFGIRGKMGSRTTKLWDGAHPDTPKVNKRYVFPAKQTAIVLSQLSRGRNAYLYGPPGTGKTEFCSELAARTGRPFALVSCDNATDGPTLIGMTVPAPGGGTRFQPGQLTRAIQTPGCVVCIDEPSVARPGALMVMQNVLANRVLFIAETGERVPVAPGVLFIACDNTNGTGGGGRKGFVDTNQLNAAYMDRFGPRTRFEYLPRDTETRVLVSYTGCTIQLAELLVDAAIVTRAAEENAQVTSGLSFRRLISWAEMLTDGIDPEDAFEAAVLNCCKDQDKETIRQQCLLAYDRTAVAKALDPDAAVAGVDPTISNPTAAGRAAAQDFAQ